MNRNSDVPVHLSQIHVRALGQCPICMVGEATSFDDLRERLERALELTVAHIESERSVLLGKLGSGTVKGMHARV